MKSNGTRSQITTTAFSIIQKCICILYMETFYWVVLAIATVLLILFFAGMAILMKKTSTGDIFPMTDGDKWNTCPDAWTISGGNCIVGNSNGNIYGESAYKITTPIPIELNTKLGSSFIPITYYSTGNIFNFGNASLCQKKAWADDFQIKWDGVTNYNKCPSIT